MVHPMKKFHPTCDGIIHTLHLHNIHVHVLRHHSKIILILKKKILS